MEESFGWCADVKGAVSIPVVVKLHGPAFLTLVDEARDTAFGRRKIDIEGRALRQIDAIVSPSQKTLLDTLARYELQPKVQAIIRNPVVCETNATQWNLEGCDHKAILYVGRFDKLKGGDTALLAFRKLLDLDRTLKLIFVGPDLGVATRAGARMTFDEFSKSVLTDDQRQSVHYLGELPRREIFELRRRAMLTIVVSRWENQPNVALEAMMQGCPVVAFDIGGMREVIEDGVTGLLARPEDIDDLCRKIMSMVLDPLRARQLGEDAHRFVNDRHNLSRITRQVVDIYRGTISNHLAT